jgi:AmmeMemoRadiSam system protein B
VPQPSIRPAAVAGLFYPESPARLQGDVDRFLAEATVRPRPTPKAIIAPHAGYVYSGAIAGSAFRALAGLPVRRVVLLGPSHRVAFAGIALPGAQAFATPLGTVPVDADLVAAVAGLPGVFPYPEAHAEEHALEVELPFLQRLLGDFTMLPLVVGEAGAAAVAAVLDAVWGGEETAIVVSSDLSHYLPAPQAERVDRQTAESILRLSGPLDPFQACGAQPINGLLAVAERRGLLPELLDLRHSGDTAGDRRRVVGYGAFAFAEGA